MTLFAVFVVIGTITTNCQQSPYLPLSAVHVIYLHYTCCCLLVMTFRDVVPNSLEIVNNVITKSDVIGAINVASVMPSDV